MPRSVPSSSSRAAVRSATPVPASVSVAGSGSRSFAPRPRRQEDAGAEEDAGERQPDGDRRNVSCPVDIGDEHEGLRADDRGNAHEQRLPASARGHHGGRREDDHRESGGCGRHARVDRLQRGRQRGADEPDAGQDLRAPRERDRGRQRGDQARERQGQCVGHEVVPCGRRREGRVGTRRAGAHGREGGEQLPVPRPDGEPGAEDERRGDRADEDALGRANPPAVRSQHEEQADPERGDRAADDREAARTEELPPIDELAGGRARPRRWRDRPGGGLHRRSRCGGRRQFRSGGGTQRGRRPKRRLVDGDRSRRIRLGLVRRGAREGADRDELVAQPVDSQLDGIESPREPTPRCVVLGHPPSSSGRRVTSGSEAPAAPGGMGDNPEPPPGVLPIFGSRDGGCVGR